MGKRLLLVEDEATLARAMARLLRRSGYDVFLAGACDEAGQAPGTFSLGVFDVDLPDGDGVELAERLLREGVVRRAVFFSGTTNDQQRQRATKLGAFVEKTAGFPQLFAMIQLMLESEHVKVAGGEDGRVGGSSSPPPSGIRGLKKKPPGRH
jgi:DNA-binding response OmpR family regulator